MSEIRGRVTGVREMAVIGAAEPGSSGRLRASLLATLLLTCTVSRAGNAQPVGVETTDIRLKYSHTDLATPTAARRLLARIGNAALEACGASTFSLADYKSAIRASRCWRDAVEDASRRIGSPTLRGGRRQ